MEETGKVIGIIGAGVMGTGVAQRFASYGYPVILLDICQSIIEDSLHAIRRNLRVHNMMSAEKHNTKSVMDLISIATDYQPFQAADFIVENATEDIAVKKQIYTKLNQYIKKDCLIMVNSSCISITKIGAFTDCPDRVIGVHYMNPVPEHDFAEVIRGVHTSENTCNTIAKLLGTINIDCTIIQDSTGYVTNRVSHIFMNEAINLVLEGVATPEQIDQIFERSFRHTMGPLHTADLIGLDTVMYSLKVLYDEYQDPRFRCSPLLKRMVDAGMLGRKSGKGFFEYV